MAQFQGIPFHPFAVETYGAFGVEAQKVISEVAAFAEQSSTPWSRSGILSGFVNAVSIAVQRGNALAILNGCQRSRAFLAGVSFRPSHWDRAQSGGRWRPGGGDR